MSEGFSRATGHNIELRYSDHDKRISNTEWDSVKKEWITGRRKYNYCTDCKQYGWGMQSLCPYNIKVVYVPNLVVSRGGE